MLFDKRGLLSLSVDEAAPTFHASLQGGWETLGLTSAHIEGTKCKCTSCGEKWRLSECSASILIETAFLENYSSEDQRQWAMRAEADHTFDIVEAFDAIRRAGERVENQMKGTTWSSQEVCESAALVAVESAMIKELNAAMEKSGKHWDEPGLHTWLNPNRRP